MFWSNWPRLAQLGLMAGTSQTSNTENGKHEPLMAGMSQTSSTENGKHEPDVGFQTDEMFEQGWLFYLQELQKGREDGRGSPSDDVYLDDLKKLFKYGMGMAACDKDAEPAEKAEPEKAKPEKADEYAERMKQLDKLEAVYKQEMDKAKEKDANERTRSRGRRVPISDKGMGENDYMLELGLPAPSAPMYMPAELTPPYAPETAQWPQLPKK